MTANKSSKIVWKYQTAAGTESIDAADDVTYEFGEYSDECDKWNVPNMNNEIQNYYLYNARTTKITPAGRKMIPWKHAFHPITAQYLAWFLKNPTDGAPDTVVSLETGLPYPINIRHEQTEGTVPRLVNLVDSYCIELYCRAMIGSPFLVETQFAYGRLEDYRGEWKFDDVVASVDGDTITLTTHGGTLNQYAGWLVFVNSGDNEDDVYTIESNTAATPTILTLTETPPANLAADTIKIFDKERPFLTTKPTNAGGADVSNCYDGRPQVIWDKDGADIAFNEVWKAEWRQSQEYKTVPDSDEIYHTIYLYKYTVIDLMLNAILETGKQWTDYIDREIRKMEIKVWKPDMTNYISHVLTNCHIIDAQETGIKNEGHYEVQLILKCEKQEGSFTFEGSEAWANHFKGGI